MKKPSKLFRSIVLCMLLLLNNNQAVSASDYSTSYTDSAKNYEAYRSKLEELYDNKGSFSAISKDLDLSGSLAQYIKLVNANNKSFPAPCVDHYVIQDVCFDTIDNEEYALVSAYSSIGEDSSIFMTKDQKTYYQIKLKSITAHLGGIASYGNNIYVTGNDATYSSSCDLIYRISDRVLLKAYQAAQDNKNKTATIQKSDLVAIHLGGQVKTSFLAYDSTNGFLWTGVHSSAKNTSFMYAFDEETLRSCKNNANLKGNYLYKVAIPTYTQGVAIRDDQVALTRSYSRIVTKNFCSELWCYKKITYKSSHTAALKNVKKYQLPSMAEGVFMGSNYLYIVYESNCTPYQNGILKTTHILATNGRHSF